ncbi:MAG: hypothetical protein JWQ21_1880 [Herminiimonas sp.]|nr:hypothetical protein [Herminiimonas sp.]
MDRRGVLENRTKESSLIEVDSSISMSCAVLVVTRIARVGEQLLRCLLDLQARIADAGRRSPTVSASSTLQARWTLKHQIAPLSRRPPFVGEIKTTPYTPEKISRYKRIRLLRF